MERARFERDRAPHGTAPRHREVRALAPVRRSAPILAPGTRPAMAPTPLEGVTVEETRLRRSMAPPAATGRSDVIRRQITDQEWGQRIAPTHSANASTTGPPCSATHHSTPPDHDADVQPIEVAPVH
jgi:hypothetical protein